MKKHKFLGFLLSLMLIAGVMPATAFAADSETPTALDISKSKEATQLEKIDGKYESTVTLSLPSAEKQLTTDVVFVLDKSTSPEKSSALEMLSKLQSELNANAKVNIGVVTFNKTATKNGFYDLSKDYDTIKEKFSAPSVSGTNLHAGILAGKDMLDQDTATDNNRKYLIVISDGITYMYDSDAKIVPYYWMNDGSPYFSKDPYSWSFKYGSNESPKDWGTWIDSIKAAIAAETISPVNYSQKDNLTVDDGVLADGLDPAKYSTSVDRALYYSYQTYQSAKDKGYNCYAISAQTGKEVSYEWGSSFMNYLAGGKTVDFTKIHNDILYLVDKGSTVADYMGYVENDYNFDLEDLSSVKLTVGGKELTPTIDGNTIHWGDKEYTLTYTPAKDGEEHFVLKLNTPVLISQPVQLSYKVVLQNPKTETGTYGVYDKYGENHEDGLFTNNSAVLNPVDTAGTHYAGQAFGKPTVSYTVSATSTPTQPTDKPAASETKTGDDSHLGLWIALALASALGLTGAAVLSRRKRA